MAQSSAFLQEQTGEGGLFGLHCFMFLLHSWLVSMFLKQLWLSYMAICSTQHNGFFVSQEDMNKRPISDLVLLFHNTTADSG